MKKILFLGCLLILPFWSNGQATSQLIEKTFEYYDIEGYKLSYREVYNYTENGDTLSIMKERYHVDNGELLFLEGVFFEYDGDYKLKKRNNKRYNPEVDLWILTHWNDYYYDDNDCLIREVQTFNIGGTSEDLIYEVGDNCLKNEALSIDELGNENWIEYTYPDANGSILSTYYFPDDGDWKKYQTTEQIKNERGDILKNSKLILNELNPPNDTAYFVLQVYEYEYFEDASTGLLTNKTQHYYNNFSFIVSPHYDSLELRSAIKHDYEYYCDGLLNKEIQTYIGDPVPAFRYTYIYSGENDCFDFEQDLTLETFPNPSNGEVSIESLIFESGNVELQVFGTNGQLFFTNSITSRNPIQKVDLSFLEKGLYIIHLKSGDHFTTSKLVIAR